MNRRSRVRPGRPALPENERKRARNLSVSPSAWQELEAHLNALQIKTASELLEKIGLNQIQLVARDASPLADVPIYRRLKSLTSEPVAVFWSILAFVKRIGRQFDLEVTDAKMYTTTMKACTIAFYIGYTHPDVLINNPSALLRWLCYKILQAEAIPAQTTAEPLTTSEPIDSQEVERRFRKIGDAFHVLRMAAHSPNYEALKMKVIDGLTIKQISRIFKLQQLEVSKAEVSSMIKRGLANFRDLLYGSSSNSKLSTTKVDQAEEPNPAVGQDARHYIHMALQEKLLDSESQQAMEKILLKTGQDSYLDFWLNEIDYDLGSQHVEVRNQIAETLEDHLVRKKTEIDRELAFCWTRDRIRQILQTYASQEAGTQLAIELLLGEKT